MKFWNAIATFLGNPDVSTTILILALAFLFYMHKMHQRQLDNRQKEIDRLARDNRDYRNRFMHFIDAKLMNTNEDKHTGE